MVKLNKEKKFNTNMGFRETVLSRIARKIEEITRRRKPIICESSCFESYKENVGIEARNEKHFDETDWPESVKTFSEIVLAFQEDHSSESSEEDDDFDDSRYPRNRR